MPAVAGPVTGIIGWPVEHSLSPVIHNAGYLAAGLDWTYARFPVHPDAVADAIAGMRALGIIGLNVTMPHKKAVMEHLDDIAEEATRIGAVNTIVRRGDRLLGANTDAAGFIRFLERDAGWVPGGRRALVLGAGGAARAVAVALTGAGAEVTLSARWHRAAEELGEELGLGITVWGAPETAKVAATTDLLVNATPAIGNELPIEGTNVGKGCLVVDLIYAPPVTPLVEQARATGAQAFNGLGMLLYQAALSFEIWTGSPAPLEAMSAALVGEIGRRHAADPGAAPMGAGDD